MERRIEAGDAPYREPEPDPQWRKDLGSPQVSTMPTDSRLWTWNLDQQHRRIEVKHAHSDQASTPDHLRRLRRTRGSAFDVLRVEGLPHGSALHQAAERRDPCQAS